MVALSALLSICLLGTDYIRGSIRKDERIVFFPTIATQVLEPTVTVTATVDGDNTYTANDTITTWNVPIHGWVFQPHRREKQRRLFLLMLRRSLNIRFEQEENEILQRRMAPFLVDNSRRKIVKVKMLDGQIHSIPRSKKNGHFYGIVRVNTTLSSSMTDDNGHASTTKLLPFQAVLTKKNDTRIFASEAHLVPPGNRNTATSSFKSISIISDIDDTVKITNVTSKKALLRNTFLEEFQPVPGMAALYRNWQQRLPGSSFHFVSSSPWQLYEELDAFRKAENFPDATFHLKSVRVKDRTLFNLFANPFSTKTKTITSIMQQFPERQFICVGDSGEKDPEVYGALARQYPNQIAYILIRDIGTESKNGPLGKTDDDEDEQDRMERAFARVPRDKWAVFSDVSEIEDLPDLLLNRNKEP